MASEGRNMQRRKINLNKHLKELLRGAVLPITLIKYSQQDADPQNKNWIGGWVGPKAGVDEM
jgi:hypothetical protein